ncbi:hypothetical protein D1227_06305 [Henriciella mobilis]|nr:hypothetical protein D1231_09295 [Henriciella mobilis]RIJ21186.1 hypothetical protein D1227_12835 [Henriciella mobilis]RIJ23113.1 hypothetical protein D1227_06305 [Henriciella mobilis]
MTRLLRIWSDTSASDKSVVQDWIRLFLDVPLASLFAAYEHFLRSDREFAPKPGQVLAKATTHAELIEMKRLAVEAALGNGAHA